ncbi:hypothetical protein Bhyg_02062 [Pseudolycoriella hygida]|uniref:Uncharacterized protein n=1 Tax=Pseudolycoriella hygida TaxID=35572 RepID=A0A9Q0NAP7_9DIPT|nr:hypothetical protein Bhyg_02062 [Pseudolycoriella hygida]
MLSSSVEKREYWEVKRKTAKLGKTQCRLMLVEAENICAQLYSADPQNRMSRHVHCFVIVYDCYLNRRAKHFTKLTLSQMMKLVYITTNMMSYVPEFMTHQALSINNKTKNSSV